MEKESYNNRNIDIMESWIAKFIAVITIFTFYGYIVMVTFYPFEHKLNMEFVNLAMGWIGGVATAVITFYFGSSAGSAEKTEMMNRAINRLPQRPIYANEPSSERCRCKDTKEHDNKESTAP